MPKYQLERKFQSKLKDHIWERIPDCKIIKNDPTGLQGVPDLLVLYHGRFAALECKRNAAAAHRPNQDYYIKQFAVDGYATFVYPENEAQVVDDLVSYFGVDNDKVQ